MSEPFIAEIRTFGFDWPPKGWSTCDGQLLAISSNQALYSLIGTTYGGDGVTTLGLPDLRGRVPLHRGNTHRVGQRAGQETVMLTLAEMPQHRHQMRASGDDPDVPSPENHALASFPEGQGMYSLSPPTGTMAYNMIGHTGGGQAHENIQPSLVMNYTIALVGIFPSRN